MTSDTRNVKLGVCKVYLGGIDLGYTKGGVEVSVTTETHKVQIDQFGITPINENIMGREVRVKCPLAETTLQNMVNIMPGASLVQAGGAAATGTVTLPVSNASDGNTVLINGKTVTFKSSGAVAAALQVNIGADVDATGTALAAMLNASTDPAIALATYAYSAGSNLLTVTYKQRGTEGNSFALAVGTYASVTVSGATLSGGTAPTSLRVDVTSGIGNDLLSIAKELRLHPVAKLETDKSDDFIIPLAATAGALTFAYKFDDERVFNTEFMGYPDPVTSKLFSVGDPTTVAS